MLGYCTIGVSDMDRAVAFYDELLGVLGGRQLIGMDRIKLYGTDPGSAMLAICIPFNEEPHDPGNGNMAALQAGSREAVGNAYRKALGLGATDEGPPGERGPGFYGAYVRDPDGNKLCFFEMSLG